MSSELSMDERIRRIRIARWKARTDLRWFANEILGYKDVSEEVHGPLLSRLQKFPSPDSVTIEQNDRFVNGTWEYRPLIPMMDLPGKRRLLILDSRGCLKTTLNAISHTLQWIINYPDIAIAIIQANLDKAEDIISEIKNHFTKNPRFRELFPEHCPDLKKVESFGTQAEFTTRARGRAVTRKEPTVRGASIEKGLAGSHFDLMKYSDIVDENNSNNAEICKTIFRKFVLSQNLLVSPRFWIDVEGTRYDEKDTYGEIIRGQEMLPEEKRDWNIFVRGIFKKDTGGKPRLYTYAEVRLPDLLDENKLPISIWPDRFPADGILSEYAMDPYLVSCTPGWGKILMSDWSEREIKDVEVGNEVVGFEEEPQPGSICHLIKSRVLATGSELGKVYKYTTNKGGVFFSTSDHLWFCGRKEKTRKYYKTPKVGNKVVRVYRPLPNNNPLLWSYLGGLIDGEGHFSKSGSNITICQSVTKNPQVSAKIQETLETLGITYNPHPRYEKQPDGSINKTILWDLQGGRNLRMSVMLNCPHLGKRDQAEAQLWNLGSRVGHQDGPSEKIVSAQLVGEMPVYWLQTTSGNYISQQYASKNCQKFNFPNHAAGGQTVFPVDDKYPAWKSRLDFEQRVLVSHYEIRVDTAQTIGERSNHSVITIGAWDNAGRLYIVDIRRGKWLAAELIAQIIAAYTTYQRKSRNGFVRVAIEETAYVTGLMLGFRQYCDQRGLHIPIETVKIDNTKSKTENIVRTLQYPYMTKQIIFLDDLKEKDALLSELSGMPKPLTDDILDTLAAFYKGKEWLGRLNARQDPTHIEQVISNRVSPADAYRQRQFARMLGLSGDFDSPSDSHGMHPDLAKTGGL